jgi:hypothetical protein
VKWRGFFTRGPKPDLTPKTKGIIAHGSTGCEELPKNSKLKFLENRGNREFSVSGVEAV